MLKSQASIDNGQSKTVAVLQLRDLEAKLGGNLATGFLTLAFTGGPVDYMTRQCSISRASGSIRAIVCSLPSYMDMASYSRYVW